MKINGIQNCYNQNFKALYKNPDGKTIDVKQETIDKAETGTYIRRRVEETLKDKIGLPLSGRASFVINTNGDCMILPASFGFIKYAGYIKTAENNTDKPSAIYTTEINRTQPKQYQDISRRLIEDGKVYASIGGYYNTYIVDPKNR